MLLHRVRELLGALIDPSTPPNIAQAEKQQAQRQFAAAQSQLDQLEAQGRAKEQQAKVQVLALQASREGQESLQGRGPGFKGAAFLALSFSCLAAPPTLSALPFYLCAKQGELQDRKMQEVRALADRQHTDER